MVIKNVFGPILHASLGLAIMTNQFKTQLSQNLENGQNWHHEYSSKNSHNPTTTIHQIYTHTGGQLSRKFRRASPDPLGEGQSLHRIVFGSYLSFEHRLDKQIGLLRPNIISNRLLNSSQLGYVK